MATTLVSEAGHLLSHRVEEIGEFVASEINREMTTACIRDVKVELDFPNDEVLIHFRDTAKHVVSFRYTREYLIALDNRSIHLDLLTKAKQHYEIFEGIKEPPPEPLQEVPETDEGWTID